MKLAAQMWTLRDFTKTEDAIEKTMHRLKEIGYNAMQVSGFGPYRVEWLADRLNELDMEVVTPHIGFDRVVNETDKVIEEMKLLRSPGVGIGSLPLEKYEREPVLEVFEKLAPAIDKIHDAGLIFAFHNHWKEFIPNGEDGKNTFDLYCERFPADRAGIIMDFYWTVYACQDPIKTIEKYRDRMGLTHLKDMAMNENGDRMFTEVYNGFIDYTTIYNKLTEVGGSWVAVEEDLIPNNGDPFEALAKSLNNIKAHGLAFENI